MLEVINEELVSFPSKIESNNHSRDTVNHIEYKITNNSSKIFYFNTILNSRNIHSIVKSKFGEKPSFLIDKKLQLFISDEDGNPCRYSVNCGYPTDDYMVYELIKDKINHQKTNLMGYANHKRYFYNIDNYAHNFIIHPNETLFFEAYVEFPNNKSSCEFSNLKEDTKYKVYPAIISDSINYKDVLPKNIIKTIKENDIKVFHGVIKAKEKIELKIIPRE